MTNLTPSCSRALRGARYDGPADRGEVMRIEIVPVNPHGYELRAFSMRKKDLERVKKIIKLWLKPEPPKRSE